MRGFLFAYGFDMIVLVGIETYKGGARVKESSNLFDVDEKAKWEMSLSNEEEPYRFSRRDTCDDDDDDDDEYYD